MPTIPITARSMEETSAIAQYFTLTSAARRASEKKAQMESEISPLKPKNSINIVLSDPEESFTQISKKDDTSSLGKNLDLVF